MQNFFSFFFQKGGGLYFGSMLLSFSFFFVYMVVVVWLFSPRAHPSRALLLCCHMLTRLIFDAKFHEVFGLRVSCLFPTSILSTKTRKKKGKKKKKVLDVPSLSVLASFTVD